MNKYIKFALWFFLGLNMFFAMWFVLHGDIFFHTDIARDFLLLDDLQKRKMVLIGPRASGLTGFFHGPLWMYLNYPVYLLSKGNPVAQGWFWIGLLVVYLVSTFLIWKRKIGGDKALIFTTLLSLFFTLDPGHPSFNGYYNPFGALFLMPLYLYLLWTYLTHKNVWRLVALIFINGLIIQFQIAFGAPLLILSFILILRLILREKKYMHLCSYGILLIPLSTYILFDLRHNFALLDAVIHPVPDPYRVYIPLIPLVLQRVGILTSEGLHFFRDPFIPLNNIMLVYMSFVVYFIFTLKKKRFLLYFTAFFYGGLMVLTLLQNGWVQYFYWMPIYPLTFLFFTYYIDVISPKIAYSILLFVIVINTGYNLSNVVSSSQFIGSNKNSWQFESQIAKAVFDDAGSNTFGFFVFAPDIFGYSSKYPFVYWSKRIPNTHMNIYRKEEITYVVIEPPPSSQSQKNNDFTWWVKHKLNIASSSGTLIYNRDGYKIEKFILKGADLTTEIAPGVNDWIYFR